jgi:hypothetical protein
METFRSRVDGWFIAVAVVVIGVGVVGAIAASTAGTALLPALVVLPAIGLVVWVWRSTRYVVTSTSLLVRSVFVHVAVPLADITCLRRTSSPLSAPALALDRIEVQHAGGAVVISPARRAEFVAAITSRNPLVDIAGVAARTPESDAQFRRQRRALAFALAGVLVAVFGLMASLNFYQLPPARVSVTSAGITVESGQARFAVSPADITSLSLEETLPPLRKRVGWGSYTSLRGRFSTERTAGWVHVARRNPPYILLQTRESFLILNDPDPARTKATYAALVGRWNASRP